LSLGLQALLLGPALAFFLFCQALAGRRYWLLDFQQLACVSSRQASASFNASPRSSRSSGRPCLFQTPALALEKGQVGFEPGRIVLAYRPHQAVRGPVRTR